MRKSVVLAFALLGGCGDTAHVSPARETIARIDPANGDGAPESSFGFMEAMETGPDLFGASAPAARLLTVDIRDEEETSDDTSTSVSQQQIAYAYGYGFRIASGRIAELQKAHVELCEAMGDECRILRISQASGDSWDGYGEVRLEVAAREAPIFGNGLVGPAERLGGELISSVRDGENLTEQIIDSEARLQSRLILRDKLTTILQDNRGSVDELVAAERAVANVNEEIDATRSKLERLRNQVVFSDVTIEYEPQFGESQLGFGRPVMTAVRSIGTTLGTTIAILIYAITALIPITLLILALRWLLHRFGLRFRFWRKRPQEATP